MYENNIDCFVDCGLSCGDGMCNGEETIVLCLEDCIGNLDFFVNCFDVFKFILVSD